MIQIEKDQNIIISMVGLPARGKSYISKKLCKYLIWLGYNTQVFNIGNYRREVAGTTTCKADFFSASNKQAQEMREQIAQAALTDMINFFKQKKGNVAIYDGTNSTISRRQKIKQRIQDEIPNSYLFFIESICDNDEVIEKNVKLTKLNNPDYVGQDADEATKDFMLRIQEYTKVYQTIDESEDLPYIKTINIGKKFIIHDVKGYLPCKVVQYLMNLHIYPRPIYLSRCGNKVSDQERFGGDQDLSKRGQDYSVLLGKYLQGDIKGSQRQGVKILTSTRQASINTAVYTNLDYPCVPMKCLDELNYGQIEGLTEYDFKVRYQDAYQSHLEKSLDYRYPQGESYRDLIARIEPVIFEIERSLQPVIVIAHNSVLRCLYSYFSSNFSQNQMDNIPKIIIPKETVIKLIPDVYFCKEERAEFDTNQMTFNINLNKPDHKNIVLSTSSQGININGITRTGSYLGLDQINFDKHNQQDENDNQANTKGMKKTQTLRKITEQFDNNE